MMQSHHAGKANTACTRTHQKATLRVRQCNNPMKANHMPWESGSTWVSMDQLVMPMPSAVTGKLLFNFFINV